MIIISAINIIGSEAAGEVADYFIDNFSLNKDSQRIITIRMQSRVARLRSFLLKHCG